MRQTSLPPNFGGNASSVNTDELNDLIMSSDGEAMNGPAPPPRIAARFNRTSNRTSNRKSASSSRRNSVSSLHSNRSKSSGHGGVHNTHIAQHLRRASIIESRKARLADRNAHAEMVRLRAAQAKAAPRSVKSLSERVAAAQQARERHLAQVAASCAEEVKRAKKVAEETREKKAAEQLQLKEDMEGKLADAEKRRLRYLQNMKRNRTTSLPVVEEKKVNIRPWKPKNDEFAARAIQRAWRNMQRRRVVADYLGLNLDIGHVQSTPFEEISSFLAEERVLAATAKMLRLCSLIEGDAGSATETTGAKSFLAAYLILGHPKEVLSKSGEQEEDLIGKAKILLMQFQRVFSRPVIERTFSPTSDHIISLTEAFVDFQTAFAAWKNHDSSILIDTMVAQFVELDAIWQTVKNDTAGMAAMDYQEGIRKNQTLILVRLKRLAGPDKALKMVNEAVRARRKSKAKKGVVGDVKPRAASAAAAPSVPAMASSSSSESVSSTSQASVGDRSRPMNELNKVISPLPENRIVVHELAINKDFKIDVDMASDARSAVNRAVFDSMRADVTRGNGDQWILSMAEIIREKLLRLVTPGKSFHDLISESLDIKVIESQLKSNTFSYEKFFGFMNSVLPKLCAPVRDAEVKAFTTDRSSDYVDRLAKLLHIIDLLALDYSNYLLQMGAPELIRQASEYEKQCFQEFLASGSLQKTTRWWRLARARTISDLIRRTPDDGSYPVPPTSAKIYATGLVNLFISLPPLHDTDLPEILALDRARIETARADTLRIVTVATILLTAKNLLKRDVRAQWRAQAQRMWELASPTATSGDPYGDPNAYLGILESVGGMALPPATRATLRGTIERVLSDARASPDVTHPVMKVLLGKLRAHVLARVSAASSEERVRTAANAGDALGAGGMAEFVGRIGGLVEEMGRVRSVDWEAHGRWIDEVADKVEQDAARA